MGPNAMHYVWIITSSLDLLLTWDCLQTGPFSTSIRRVDPFPNVRIVAPCASRDLPISNATVVRRRASAPTYNQLSRDTRVSFSQRFRALTGFGKAVSNQVHLQRPAAATMADAAHAL